MLTLALALAAASPTSEPLLAAEAPWWEKIVMTISGDGSQQSCRFESSAGPAASKNCEVDGASKASAGSQAANSPYTKMTFERRFSPAGRPDMGSLQPGDTLLGRQIMALAIDASGSVQGCRVLIASGDVLPDYGCEEAKAEQFAASANRSAAVPREAYMTVLVYGHEEQLV